MNVIGRTMQVSHVTLQFKSSTIIEQLSSVINPFPRAREIDLIIRLLARRPALAQATSLVTFKLRNERMRVCVDKEQFIIIPAFFHHLKTFFVTQ